MKFTREITLDNFHIRSEQDFWAVGGRAINWDTPSKVTDYDPNTGEILDTYIEEFAPNSIMIPADGVTLYDDHGADIGTLTRSELTDTGWDVELAINKTEAGRIARDEIKSGKKHSFSIGFAKTPIETAFDKMRNVQRRIKALVGDISITSNPQHLQTNIAFVRSTPQGEKPMADEKPEDNQTPAPADTSNLLTRSEFDDSIRNLRGEISQFNFVRSTPSIDPRTPGEVFKSLLQGDTKTVERYEETLKRSYSERIAGMQHNRAFPTNGITDDSVVLDAWVGDLTKLVQEPAIIANAFSTGPLPDTGNFIEYGALKADSTGVDEQAAEGDDLDFGHVEVESKTAAVKTYGGYSEASRQVLERSSIAYLDTLLRAMALRAGKRINTVFRTTLESALATQVTASRKVTITDETSWEQITDGLIDGVDLLLDEGLTATSLITDKATFKVLKNMTADDGRPTMNLDGPGVNNVGAVNLAGLSGRLAGINVICDPNWSYDPTGTVTNNMALVNSEAIRFRSSGIAQLTDENIVALSKIFSLYFYAAIAIEIPKGVVPIEITI